MNEERARYYIYQLIDPRDQRPRYVGQTQWMKERYEQHLAGDNSTDAMNAWIQELRNLGLYPIMQALEQVHGTVKQARQHEAYWIRHLLDKGMPLLNVSNTRTEPPLKISFYPTATQDHKLKNLIVQYWLRHKRMINQNDILRHLVEHCTLDDLNDLGEAKK